MYMCRLGGSIRAGLTPANTIPDESGSPGWAARSRAGWLGQGLVGGSVWMGGRMSKIDGKRPSRGPENGDTMDPNRGECRRSRS